MSQTSDLDHQQSPPSRGKLDASEYEFTMLQNQTLRKLAQKMKYVGLFYVFAGGLLTLISVIALFKIPVAGFFYLVFLAPQLLVGIWNIRAANSFGSVVETEGNDIAHLMSALGSLQKLYTLMFWLMILGITMVVIGVATGIFLWSWGSFPMPMTN